MATTFANTVDKSESQSSSGGLFTNDSYFIIMITTISGAVILLCCCIVLFLVFKRRRARGHQKEGYKTSNSNISLSRMQSGSSEGGDIDIDNIEMNNTTLPFKEAERVNSASTASPSVPTGVYMGGVNRNSILPDATPLSMANSIGSPMSNGYSSPFELGGSGNNNNLLGPLPPGPVHVALSSHSRNQSYGAGVLQMGNPMNPKAQARGKRAVTSASVASDMNVIAGMVTPGGDIADITPNGDPNAGQVRISMPPLPSELDINTGEDADGEDYDDMYDPAEPEDIYMQTDNDKQSQNEQELDELYDRGADTRTAGAALTDDGGHTDDGHADDLADDLADDGGLYDKHRRHKTAGK